MVTVFSDLTDEDETIYQSELSPLIILQKKNKKDFALWKARKSTEVGFDASFCYDGKNIQARGRPGWHIECSAMIDQTIGPDLDIHFGGIDLKFPHHHNERLQAHAFYHPMFKPQHANSPQWATEFMHIGHLCIKGHKMSKSLKNFTTIEQALNVLSPNQFRILFCIHKWTDSMDFSDDTVSQAVNYDTIIKNFFNRVINYPFNRNDVKTNKKEIDIMNYFYDLQLKIENDLNLFNFDNFITALLDLINRTNAYIGLDTPNKSVVKKIYVWINKILNDIGFSYGSVESNSGHDINSTTSISDVMNVIVETRKALRLLTRDTNTTPEVKKNYLKY